MTSSKLLLVPALASALILNACGPEKTEQAETTATAADTTATATPTYEQNVDTLMASVPKPSKVPGLIALSGADFNANLLNPVSKASNYTTTSSKAALNLGVYASDMSYLSAYEKAKDAQPYLQAVKKLAQTAGVANAMPPTMEQRFEKNMQSTDSLMALVDELMQRTHTYLKENQRQNTASLIMAGSFVEGLYTSTGLVETYPRDVPEETRNSVLSHLVQTIMEQKKSLGALINMLQAGEQDQQTKDLVSQLKELQAKFQEANFEEKMKNNKGDLVLNDQTLKDITAKVKDIRGRIVG